eukprot:4802670-Pleurochrysis_carterae.AAC.2
MQHVGEQDCVVSTRPRGCCEEISIHSADAPTEERLDVGVAQMQRDDGGHIGDRRFQLRVLAAESARKAAGSA